MNMGILVKMRGHTSLSDLGFTRYGIWTCLPKRVNPSSGDPGDDIKPKKIISVLNLQG